MREKATLTRDVALAALRGEISEAAARTYFHGNREVRKDILAGQKIGEDVVVLRDDSAVREQELLAELAALRRRRQ